MPIPWLNKTSFHSVIKQVLKLTLTSACCLVITCCNTGYEVKDNEVLYKDWNEGSGYFYKNLAKVDIHSFQVLKHSFYAIDKSHAYYKGKLIKGADAKTFHPIDDYFAVDEFSAYYQNKKIDYANGKNFRLITKGPYGKDNNDYYYYTAKMNVSDLTSFKVLDESWSKDKSFYYIQAMSDTVFKYPLADYKSFKLLGCGYAKDKVQVYYWGEVIKGADPSSFKIRDNIRCKAKDKFNCFNGAQQIDCE